MTPIWFDTGLALAIVLTEAVGLGVAGLVIRWRERTWH